MARKNTDPDLFAADPAEKPKALSPKITQPATIKETKSRNQCVAEVCGLIAGMPDGFARAAEALEDIQRRAIRASLSTGILTPAQTQRLKDIQAEITAIGATLLDCHKVIDGMIAAGVALPPKV